MIELALHLEKMVIDLKIDALRMWNVALAGTACGNLLSLTENAYGYPESRQSIENRWYLGTVEWEFTENEPDAEPAKGLTNKEAATAEDTSQPLPAKRRNGCLRGATSANSNLLEQPYQLPWSIYIKLVCPRNISLRKQVQKANQSTNVCTWAVLIQKHNLLNAVPTSIENTWVCALNADYVISTVLGLWTYRSILKMSTWMMRTNGLNQCQN